jgi:septum site-determining protein MinC
MTTAVRHRPPMRIRGRSFMAFALTPEPPIADWLTQLDGWIRSSTGFFVGRPVVLDLAAVKLSGADIAHLVSELEGRDIRVMGLEGVDPAEVGPKLPPVLKGGRATSMPEASRAGATAVAPAAPSRKAAKSEPTSLLIKTPVRSGQSVVFENGDVTVLGSVSSGAEIVAGGSIHVYGAIRGRAMAGANGNAGARIFCSRVEAELLAIDGYYRTAEDMDRALIGRPVHAWLDGGALLMAALD